MRHDHVLLNIKTKQFLFLLIVWKIYYQKFCVKAILYIRINIFTFRSFAGPFKNQKTKESILAKTYNG